MPELLELDPCNFCHEVAQAKNGYGLHFLQTHEAIALPTLGCFVRGYSLIVPTSHVASLADLPGASRRPLFETAEYVRERIEFLFGPTLIAEHGSGAPEEPTAACCVHAHLHLIPVGSAAFQVQHEYEATGGKGQGFEPENDLDQLAGSSYLTLSLRPGEWTVWKDASRFPRQFVRRATANALGRPTVFDWKRSPFVEHMRETTELMKRAIAAQNSDS